MKDSSLVSEFPSLSSLTLTSRNSPFYSKSITSSTTNLSSYNHQPISKPIDDEKVKYEHYRVDLESSKKYSTHWCIIPRFLKVKHFRKRNRYTHHLNQYGKLQQNQVGTGASAVVLLTHPIIDSEGKMRVYAIKVFQKRKSRENDRSFMKKLISEFCIASALEHLNICKTLDLVLDEKKRYCIVMEYCSGGDLYSYIKEGHLEDSIDETHDLFKQLLTGLSYLHELGVAHRDIKPENLLLVKKREHCSILKITDFGEADVFRETWQPTNHRLSYGLCGSTPYIAPEIFLHFKQGYIASQADVWSAGIVYFCMRMNGVPFFSAQQTDSNYRLYQKHYSLSNYPAFDSFDHESRQMLYAMLNVNPDERLTVKDLLESNWLTRN
ncbi:kinase-like domain-containing protein [Choanephora cucurbitarum]|nr:kinase-like domain-containing protein [Choanephora cucurbitarum]KAI8379882.1 kinase-like domain-containing protein [Choanephora cucurbitarum]